MTKMSFVKIAAMAALGAVVSVAGAQAADFPSKDIKIIVPFAPGGAVDVTSRIIAEYANKHLDGVKVVVENRAGGGGVVGQTYAANAKADGYTVLAMTSSVVTNPVLKKTGYEVADFAPVALYTLDPEVIVVPTDSPFKTAEDFVAEAKKRPINTVVAGIATSHHLSGLALEDSAAIKFNYIPTSGFGAQLQAIMGGHAEAALWPFGETKKHAEAGSVRILAVADDAHLAAFPNIPTWKEAGMNLVRWPTFRGWAVPKGTPKEAIAFLSNLLGKVNQDKEYVARMTDYGYPLAYKDAKGFADVVADYAKVTSEVVAKHGLQKK